MRPEIPPELDWPHFAELAGFHRVQGLVWNALAERADRLPDDVKIALSSAARSIAATNMAIAAECNALGLAFRASKLPLLFLKGLTVGALAYRSPLLKMGWDIDLLIEPRDLSAAANLLRDRGYVLRLPASFGQLESWHERSKESVWTRNGNFHVELHTRLADNVRMVPTIDVDSPMRMVEVAHGVSLPTLAEDELFAYLAVHGASSAWFRLKWLADFAALIDRRSGDEIERLYRRSQELGAGRAAGQALLLAHSLFDVLRPVPALRDQLASDPATQLLCRAALRMMTSGERDPTEKLLGTLTIHWTQLLLQPGLGFQLSELGRQFVSLVGRLRR